VKKPKKPKVKSSSAISKKTTRNLSPPLPQEPIKKPAKSLPQTNTAGQQQEQQMKNPPRRWSLMKRAGAAVVGLIPPKRPKGP
jgi:hypothetical protein